MWGTWTHPTRARLTVMPFPRIPAVARVFVAGCVLAGLGGCAATLRPQAFAATSPTFDPVSFWTGHTQSWGVRENRGGAPVAIVTTRTEGTPETTADGVAGLHMVQHLTVDGVASSRDWHMRRLGNGVFEATANDMIGTATGTASGRMFHWTWTWAREPGNAFSNVSMDQWMYLADNGTLMNRTIITKLGVRLGEVSEQFVRAEPTTTR